MTSPLTRLSIRCDAMRLSRVALGMIPLSASSIWASTVAAVPEGNIAPADRSCCSVLELRQYTLKPGQRDVLIELFDREFVETQEALGMRLFGQFRDKDRPDHFVWLRAYPDMQTRGRALDSFYSGPVWKAHRERANATMIDVSDVLLLHPVDPPTGFSYSPATRAPVGAPAPTSLVTATIYSLQPAAARKFPAFFRDIVRPALHDAGIVPLATFETEPAANNFPALPVREGEHVFLWFASFESPEAYRARRDGLSRSRSWSQVSSDMTSYLASPPQELRLEPTARSLLR